MKNKRFIDYTGQKINRWLVIKQVESYEGKSKKSKWLCRCECGTEKVVFGQSLKSKMSKSCGCFNKEKLWKGYEGISGVVFFRIKRNAKNRNHEFNVTIEYLWNLWLKQEGKCDLTGLDLIMQKDCYYYNKKDFVNIHTASLDRIDNSKGYIEGNVRWIHKDVNWIKQDFSDEVLFNYCKLIIKHKNII